VERVCFTLHVRPDRLDEYKRRHRQVWPEMLRALSETGWRNYSLILRDDGLLIGYLEMSDFQQELAVNQRWQREMAPFFTGLAGRPDEGMKRIEEVFHLD
jgi:L-rhamnose mutarotase